MSETKNDRTERNTARKNVSQTKKKDSKRETTLTHYRNSIRQIEMKRQPKKEKNKECGRDRE